MQHICDVHHKTFGQCAREIGPDDETQHGDVVGTGRHWVCWHDPPVAAEHGRDLELVVLASVLEGECHHRNANVLRNYVEASCVYYSFLYNHCVFSTVLHHITVALETSHTNNIIHQLAQFQEI